MLKYVLIVTFAQGAVDKAPFGVGTLHDTEEECYRIETPRLKGAHQILAHCYTVQEAMEQFGEDVKWQ